MDLTRPKLPRAASPPCVSHHRIGALVTDAVTRTPNFGWVPSPHPPAARSVPATRLGDRVHLSVVISQGSARRVQIREYGSLRPDRLAHSWNVSVLFRDRALPHAFDMATLARKIEAERRMRGLLESEGLPTPDRVEYGEDCIRLFFEETKTAVVIDLDDETGSDRER